MFRKFARGRVVAGNGDDALQLRGGKIGFIEAPEATLNGQIKDYDGEGAMRTYV
jgi:hypothetical protein